MSNFLSYLLQASVVFTGLYFLYRILFSRFTFHQLNRSILLLIVPISLLLPLSSEWFPQLQEIAFELPLVEEFSNFAAFEAVSHETLPTENTPFNFYDWLLMIYVIGVVCFLARFVRTNYKLIVLKKHAQKVYKNDTTLYVVDTPEAFSFFKWIFVPFENVSSVNELIITHEKAHVQQFHSVDVICTELFITFFWFHPFVYLYRNSLKSIHEFQADAHVLQQHVKKSTYLEVLLQSLAPKNINPVYNYFSHPILKKRIEMMTKPHSKKTFKLTYLLLLPAVAFAFLAFKKADESTMTTTDHVVVLSSDGIPSIFPVQNGNKTHISSAFGVVRKHPKLPNKQKHSGIDIKAKTGTPIVATADGVVTKASAEGNWGNLIIISHADGFETWYAHLKGFNTTVRSNVKKGDIIGYVGNTGLSTAPHLHYEVRQDGTQLDPIKFITE